MAFATSTGYNTGEKAETYWAIRSYEIAIEEGSNSCVYGNLDYGSRNAGYDSRFRTGHYDGKGRVGEWILFQNLANRERMGVASHDGSVYRDGDLSPTPMTPTVEDGVVTWRVPLGEGAVPHCHLRIADTTFVGSSTIPSAPAHELEVAIDHIAYADLAAAFRRSTGIPSALNRHRSRDVLEERSPQSARTCACRVQLGPIDKSTMSVRDNFTGILESVEARDRQRNYALLDEIPRIGSEAPRSGSGEKSSRDRS